VEVLYVEDTPANTILMQRIFAREQGWRLLHAANAEAGVEIARSRRPIAIIMDLNLPGMSGVEAMRVLKSMPETADIPIMALTASASPSDVEKGLKAGFVAYLTKPVDIEMLLSKLKELTGRR
jgi:CheY-like chemotaxis protein